MELFHIFTTAFSNKVFALIITDMFKPVFFLLVSLTCILTPANPAAQPSIKTHSSRLEIHNRVLWNYRGSIITVMDVAKRLEQYGQTIQGYASMDSTQKLEFYQQNWRGALQELIDQELIYQDAIDHNMTISDSEARDQLVKYYGEYYITRVDEMGLTMKEALDNVKRDILTQRMMYFRVHYQAKNALTPAVIASTYKEMCKDQPETDLWAYQAITFKGPFETCQNLAKQWQLQLCAQKSIESCQKELSSQDITVSVGKLNQQTSQHLSQRYLDILSSLEPQKWSEPVVFKEDPKEAVIRLFFLESKTHQAPPAFAEVRAQIEDAIYQKTVAEENQKYIVKLRRQLEQEQGNSLQQVFNPTSPLFSVR